MKNNELILYAIKAIKNSYSPYSKFKVGAALLTNDGKVYTGCNIENSSFSATNCAERTAFFKAISEGEKAFKKIAIVAYSDTVEQSYIPPCGVCRQVMCEFCDENFEVISAKSENDYRTYKLKDLLPLAFTCDNLGEQI